MLENFCVKWQKYRSRCCDFTEKFELHNFWQEKLTGNRMNKNPENWQCVFPIWKLHNPYCHNTYRRLTRIHKYWIAQMNTIPYVRCKWLNRCNNIWQGGKRPFPGTWRPFDQRFWFLNLHNHFCLWMSTLKKETVFCYQNCFDLLWKKNRSSDREKLLKFEVEGRDLQNSWDH